MVKLTNTGPYQPSPADVAEAGWGPSSTQPIHNNIAMSRTTTSTQLAKCSDRALPGCLPKLPGSSKQWKGPIMISTTHLFTWLTYCTIVDQPKSNICLLESLEWFIFDIYYHSLCQKACGVVASVSSVSNDYWSFTTWYWLVFFGWRQLRDYVC